MFRTTYCMNKTIIGIENEVGKNHCFTLLGE